MRINRFESGDRRSLNVPIGNEINSSILGESLQAGAISGSSFIETYGKVLEQNEKSLAQKNILDAKKELFVLTTHYENESQTADIKEQKRLKKEYDKNVMSIKKRVDTDPAGHELYRSLVRDQTSFLAQTSIATGSVTAIRSIQESTIRNEQRANETATEVYFNKGIGETQVDAIQRTKHLAKQEINKQRKRSVIRDNTKGYIMAMVQKVRHTGDLNQINAAINEINSFRSFKDNEIKMSDHIDDSVYNDALNILLKLKDNAMTGQSKEAENRFKELRLAYLNNHHDKIALVNEEEYLRKQFAMKGDLRRIEQMELFRAIMPKYHEDIVGKTVEEKEFILNDLISNYTKDRKLSHYQTNEVNRLKSDMKIIAQQDEIQKNDDPATYAENNGYSLKEIGDVHKFMDKQKNNLKIKNPLPIKKHELIEYLSPARDGKYIEAVDKVREKIDPKYYWNVSEFISTNKDTKFAAGVALGLISDSHVITDLGQNLNPEYIETINARFKTLQLDEKEIKLGENEEVRKLRAQLDREDKASLGVAFDQVITIEAKKIMVENPKIKPEDAVTRATNKYQSAVFTPIETNFELGTSQNFYIPNKYTRTEEDRGIITDLLDSIDLATLKKFGFDHDMAKSIIEYGYIKMDKNELHLRFGEGRKPVTKDGREFIIDLDKINDEDNPAYENFSALRRGDYRFTLFRNMLEEDKNRINRFSKDMIFLWEKGVESGMDYNPNEVEE